MAEKQNITVLLQRIKKGENHLLNDIYSQLYNDIKAIANNQINQLQVGQTITPTVIANECYLKLAIKNNIDIHDRRHFLNYLAKSMRLLLIDIMRSKSSLKKQHITTTQKLTLIIGNDDIELKYLEIELLLKKVERINRYFCELLEFKLIFNLTFKEISTILNKSERQINRDWKQASALILALSKESKLTEQLNSDK